MPTLNDTITKVATRIPGAPLAFVTATVIESYRIWMSLLPDLCRTLKADRTEITLTVGQVNYALPSTMVSVSKVFIESAGAYIAIAPKSYQEILNKVESQVPVFWATNSSHTLIDGFAIIGKSSDGTTAGSGLQIVLSKPPDSAYKLHVFGSQVPATISTSTILPEILPSYWCLEDLATYRVAVRYAPSSAQGFFQSAMNGLDIERMLIKSFADGNRNQAMSDQASRQDTN